MWVHQSVDWSKNVSPEVGKGGGGASTGIVSKGEIHWILEEWYTFCGMAVYLL